MTNRTRRAIIITVAVLVMAGIARRRLPVRPIHHRHPRPDPHTGRASQHPRRAISPSASYEPTDEWGSPEPALPRGQAEAGAGGTTTGPGGLPLGYSHDQTGAVNAATNYLMWMNSLKITDKKLADNMAAATAADDATKQALIESFDALRPGMADLTADQPEPARGAYAVADYSRRSCADLHLVSRSRHRRLRPDPAPVGHRRRSTVVWTDGDWKLDGGLITKTGGAAVDPGRSGRQP